MAMTAEIHEALDLDKLKLPASPRVIQLIPEDDEGTDGEPALRITAVIDESTDLEQLNGHDIGEMKFVIRESLRQHGISLFPYIIIVKPSELEDDEYDEEDEGE